MKVEDSIDLGTFNILCVSKCCSLDYGPSPERHLPITGSARVYLIFEEKEAIVLPQGVYVDFNSLIYEFSGVRSGLSGTALVICIKVKELPFNIWHLYSDTPVNKAGVVTPEIVQAKAIKAMQRRE